MLPHPLLVAACAFALGSFPTAYLAVRFLKKTDIRRHGSGNVGATNAMRLLGKKWGTLVFLTDAAKGFVPAFWVLQRSQDPQMAVWLGSASVLGHVFTPFLRFKGGKGVATGAGVLSAAYPLLFIIAICVFAVLLFLTRIVSVSSILSVGCVPFLTVLFYPKQPYSAILFSALFVFVLWTHRQNLSRLKSGIEKRL
jgi:glycerol-3-phosphate acyltransferase PlsY